MLNMYQKLDETHLTVESRSCVTIENDSHLQSSESTTSPQPASDYSGGTSLIASSACQPIFNQCEEREFCKLYLTDD